MNDEFPHEPGMESEARVTALLLGELTGAEAASLRQAIEDDAELAALHERLQKTVTLVREVAASPTEPAATQSAPMKLSEDKRQKLMAQFKTVKVREFETEKKRERKRVTPAVRLLELAAILMLMAIPAGLLLPALAKSKAKAQNIKIANNLKQIDLAKRLWADDNQKSAGDEPTVRDLAPYLGRGTDGVPPSVSGETYLIGRVGENASAELDAEKVRQSGGKVEGGSTFGARLLGFKTEAGQKARLNSNGRWELEGPKPAEELARNYYSTNSVLTHGYGDEKPPLSGKGFAAARRQATEAKAPAPTRPEIYLPPSDNAAGQAAIPIQYANPTDVQQALKGQSNGGSGGGGSGGGTSINGKSVTTDGQTENFQRNAGVGQADPDWVGALDHSAPKQSGNNPFVSNYGYVAGNGQLDLNGVQNQSAAVSGGRLTAPAGNFQLADGDVQQYGANGYHFSTPTTMAPVDQANISQSYGPIDPATGLPTAPPNVQIKTKFVDVTQNEDTKNPNWSYKTGVPKADLFYAETPPPVALAAPAPAPAPAEKAGGEFRLGMTRGDIGGLKERLKDRKVAETEAGNPPQLGDVPITGGLFAADQSEPRMARRAPAMDQRGGQALMGSDAESLARHRGFGEAAKRVTPLPGLQAEAAQPTAPAAAASVSSFGDRLNKIIQSASVQPPPEEFVLKQGNVDLGLKSTTNSTVLSGYVDTNGEWNHGSGDVSTPAYHYGRESLDRSKADGFNLNTVTVTLDEASQVTNSADGRYYLDLNREGAISEAKANENIAIASDESIRRQAVNLSYRKEKAELEQLQKSRDALAFRTFQENVETIVPKTTMVDVIEHADPNPDEKPSLLRRMGDALSGTVERKARIKVEKDVSDVEGIGEQRRRTEVYDPQFVQSQFEAIQSEPVLDQVIEKLKLDETWAKNHEGQKLNKADARRMLKSRLDIKAEKNSSLVDIGVKSDKPEEAAQIANTVAQAYKDYRAKQRTEATLAGIKNFEKNLDDLDRVIKKKQARVADLAQEIGVTENVVQAAISSTPVAPTNIPDAPLQKPAAPAPDPQPEVLTSTNAFSTFSLNVADVSFKLAAASLEKGVMPEPASIRSEEFINAFDYRDPEAPPGVPIAFAWERARYPFAQNRDLLRFSLKTAATGRAPGRPLNIVLLLDNSGSMERADRVAIIREALRVLAGQLQPQDRLSIVTFARTARLFVDAVPGDQAGDAVEKVSGLTPQGGTNLEDAMKLAYETARRHYFANGVNRVVLLTDGAANLGNVDPEALKKKVEANRKQGVALDCFGIGWEGYNDDLLEVLARNGDGRYGFLNTPEEAATGFAHQLAGALNVAAADVKVQVEFNPNRVTVYRQIGYAKLQLKKEQFRDNTVDAAEIGAAEAGNALYTLEVNPNGEGALATVRVRYKVPGTEEFHEHEWAVPYNGGACAMEQSSPAMRLAATASAFSEWLAGSPFAAEVTPDALLKQLSGVPEIYGADTRPQKLEWMLRQAKSLQGK